MNDNAGPRQDLERYSLSELSENDVHLTWVLEQHAPEFEYGRDRCHHCSTTYPCDIASLAGSALYRANDNARLTTELAAQTARAEAAEQRVAALEASVRHLTEMLTGYGDDDYAALSGDPAPEGEG